MRQQQYYEYDFKDLRRDNRIKELISSRSKDKTEVIMMSD